MKALPPLKDYRRLVEELKWGDIFVKEREHQILFDSESYRESSTSTLWVLTAIFAFCTFCTALTFARYPQVALPIAVVGVMLVAITRVAFCQREKFADYYLMDFNTREVLRITSGGKRVERQTLSQLDELESLVLHSGNLSAKDSGQRYGLTLMTGGGAVLEIVPARLCRGLNPTVKIGEATAALLGIPFRQGEGKAF